MFTTVSAEKILFTLIGTLFALCSFSTVGCGGGAISSVHAEDLRQSVKTVESERDKALKRAKTAEDTIASVKTERDKALRRAKTAEDAIASVKTERDKALRRAKTAEDAIASVKTERDRAFRRAKTAEDVTASVKTERDRALRRAKTAEDAIVSVKTERDKALRRAKTAETERDRALQRVKMAEEESGNLRKLVSRVPQAAIKNVSVNRKKRSLDITVKFSINNRKGIKDSVNVYFYFQNGTPLRDKKGPISISEEFTPKRVKDEQTVKLSMPYGKLHVTQPANLKFAVRIYDEPTDNFLEENPYTKSFRYDPFGN